MGNSTMKNPEKIDSLDLAMREPIIFYYWDTFFTIQHESGTGVGEKENILRNFMTSGVRERHRRFGIKNFIIHLRATQTLIEIRLFKGRRSWAKRISYQQKPRLCVLVVDGVRLSRTAEEDREWLKFRWVFLLEFTRSFFPITFFPELKKTFSVHLSANRSLKSKKKKTRSSERKFIFLPHLQANGGK